MRARRERLRAPALAFAAACLVLFGAHEKGASWPAAGVLAVLLGLGVLLVIRDRTPATRAEIGRGLVVGALIALTIGWIQLDNDSRLRQAENRRQDEAVRRDLQLLLSRENDLGGIELEHRDLSRFLLSRKDLGRAHLRQAILQSTDLRGASLRLTDLAFADLRDADLSPAGLTVVVSGLIAERPIRPKRKESDDVDSQLRTGPVKVFDVADLRGAVLRWADLRGADLRWARLDRDSEREPNDSGVFSVFAADLRSADLRRARLNGATFEGANLGNADLRGTRLGARQAAEVGHVRCDQTILPEGSGRDPVRAGCEATPAPVGHAREVARRRALGRDNRDIDRDLFEIAPIFVDATLVGARLDDADMRRGDFRGADLRRAVLRGADLRRTDLQFADLRGADLRGTKIAHARLQGAAWDRSTRWPTGFSPRRGTATPPGREPETRSDAFGDAVTVPSSVRVSTIRRLVTRHKSR